VERLGRLLDPVLEQIHEAELETLAAAVRAAVPPHLVVLEARQGPARLEVLRGLVLSRAVTGKRVEDALTAHRALAAELQRQLAEVGFCDLGFAGIVAALHSLLYASGLSYRGAEEWVAREADG
jgi:hypothetical protein